MANKPSVDGFIPRRSPSKIGEYPIKDPKTSQGDLGLQRRQIVSPMPASKKSASYSNAIAPTDKGLSKQQNIIRADVDESLREIDNQSNNSGKKPRKVPKRRFNRRKVIKWSIIAIVLIGIAIGGWLAYRAILAGGSVFKGDVFGLVQQKALKTDSNGRSNVLILGTSEDDPGHPGAFLTDSLMVLSVDQKKHNAFMISIPRDLLVKYGMACNSGYSGKINEYFNCVNGDWDSTSAEDERQAESRKFFGDIVGLDIQYSVHVNYSVMRDVVKALGGITVTIESPDPRGQMDANFDWKCGDTYAKRLKNCPPRGHFIDYPNGPVNLDAEHALYLAQARGDADNWGFPNSNFEREKNQQKIVVAIKEKAMSTGTLTNIGKVSGLIDALGKNLRTNFDTSEIRTLMSIAKETPSSSIKSLSLIDNHLVDGSAQPTAGQFNFSAIQAFIKKSLNSSPLAAEAAHVVVLNASGVAGVAQTEANRLTELGLEIDQVGNAPAGGKYTANTLYQVKTDKPLAKDKLASIYSATPAAADGTIPVPATTDYIIIIVSQPSAASAPSQ